METFVSFDDSIVQAVASLLPLDIVRSGAVDAHAAANDEGVMVIVGGLHVVPVHNVPCTGQPLANEAHTAPPHGLPVAIDDFVVIDP